MNTFTAQDLTYRTAGGSALLGRLYRPLGISAETWVIDVHGGAWRSGDRFNNAPIHRDLAEHGVGVFALDFRLSDTASYPAPVHDVCEGIRWFRANAESLGLSPRRVGGLGSSSGGQQLGLIALRPDGAPWSSNDHDRGEAHLDFLVACWPILDPLARYRMAQDTGNDGLIDATRAYFADEDAIIEGNPYLVLQRGEATHFPPVLILQGTLDRNVEPERAEIFAELYRDRGGKAEVVWFEGQPHTFITVAPGSEASRTGIARIRDFVLSVCP